MLSGRAGIHHLPEHIQAWMKCLWDVICVLDEMLQPCEHGSTTLHPQLSGEDHRYSKKPTTERMRSSWAMLAGTPELICPNAS